MQEKNLLFYSFSKFIFFFFFLFSFSLAAHAIPRMKAFSVPSLDAGVFFGLGEQKLRDAAEESETYSFGAYIAPGLNLVGGIKLGLYGELHIAKNRSNPVEEFPGTGYLLGVSTSLNITPFYVLAAYNFVGNYSVDDKTNTKFSKPQALHFILGFSLHSELSLDIGLASILYSKKEVEEKEVAITDKFRWRTLRLSLTFHL